MRYLLKCLLLCLCWQLAPASEMATDQERFDINVQDVPARAFFNGLVAGTAHNMLVQAEVSGRITLTLTQVTLEEALDAVRELYGYDYRRVGNGYLVLAAGVQTRLFTMNYLDLKRRGVSSTRVSSGQITQAGNSSYAATSGSTNASAGETTPEGTAVTTQSTTDFWQGIEADIKAVVGDKPGRSVFVNRQSGVLMVRAMPSELRDVAQYLQSIASTVSRQVILEAKIIEVELNDAYQAGINWAALANTGGGKYFFGQAAPTGGFDANPFAGTGNTTPVAPGNPVTGFVNSTLGGAFTLAADFSSFNAFIELLSAQGQARVLSSPRVSTLNNQKAIIKAGTDEFFVTKVSSNTTTGTATTTTRDVELTPFFSGVALDVTPVISADGSVTLHMHPAISEVTDQIKKLTVSGTTDTLPLALSQIRESDSIVRARSGQMIVIGGLMRETSKRQNYRTPLLGDIPWLGKLFRSERQQTKTLELVILLRPLVVEDGEWAALAEESQTRINALQQQGAARP